MITDPAIEKFLYDLLPPRDPVLAEMEAAAAAEQIPIVGPAVGTLLALVVSIHGARRIFELGSAIGYSTLWMARAAGAGAEVHYSDASPRNAARARGWIERAGVADRVRFHIGDALDALRRTPGEFDLIFNDVDKEGYPQVLTEAIGRLRPGGVFVSDNTLWHGRVLDPPDEASRAVLDFDRKLFTRKDLTTILVPLRDGVTISFKIE